MSSRSEAESDVKASRAHFSPHENRELDEEGKMEHNSKNAHLYALNKLESSPECSGNVENYSYASSAKSTSTSLSSSLPCPNVSTSSSSINNNLQTCQEIKCNKELCADDNETCSENDLVELNRLKRENRFLRLQLLRVQEERQRQEADINMKKEEEQEHKNGNNKELNKLQPYSVTESSAVCTRDSKTAQSDAWETKVNEQEGNGKVSKEKCEEIKQLIEVPTLCMVSPYATLTHEDEDRFGNDSVSSNYNSSNNNTSLMHSHSSNEMWQSSYNQERTNGMESELDVQEGHAISPSNDTEIDMTTAATASTTTVQENKSHNVESCTCQNVCEEPLQFQEKQSERDWENELYNSTGVAHQCTHVDTNNSNDMDVCEENEALKLRLQMLQRKSNREKLKRAATERQLRCEIELLRLALDREASNLYRTQEQEQLQLSLEHEESHYKDSCRVNSAPTSTFALHPTQTCELKTNNFQLSTEANKELTQESSVEVISPGRKLELEVATNELKTKMNDNNSNNTNTLLLDDKNRRKNRLQNTEEKKTTEMKIKTRMENQTSHYKDVNQTLSDAENDLFASPLNSNQLSFESSELPVAYALHMNSNNRRAERKARLLQVQRQMLEYIKEEEELSSPPPSSPPEASTPITTVATTTTTRKCKDSNENNDTEQSKLNNNKGMYSSVAFRRQRKQQQQELRYWFQNKYNYASTTSNITNNNNYVLTNPNQIGIEVTDKIKNRSWYLCKVIAYALRHSIQACKQVHVCNTSTTTSSTLLDEHTQQNNDVEISSTSKEAKAARSSPVAETSNVNQIPFVMSKISSIALQRAINETVSYEFRCMHNLPHILLTPRSNTMYYDHTNQKSNTSNNNNNNNNSNHCKCKVGFNEFCSKCQFQTCDLVMEERNDTLSSPIHSLMSSATSYPHCTSIDNFNNTGSNKQTLHSTHECTSKEWNNVAFEEENDDANLISTFASSFPTYGSNYNKNNNNNGENLSFNGNQDNNNNRGSNVELTNTKTTFASSSTSPSFFSPVSVNESNYHLHPRSTSTYSYSCNSSPANRSPRSPFHKSHQRGNYFSNKGELREDVVSVTFHAPVIFAQIRDYLQCNSNELREAAAFSAWRQSLSPGKSGATLYYFGNYMVKSLRESEFTFFIRKLLPAYAMYCERNPHTFLCHFYALWTVEWVKTNDRQRYVLMHNIFNTRYYIHRIYDVKGSSLGRSGYTNSHESPEPSSSPESSPSSLSLPLSSSTSKTKNVKSKKPTKDNFNEPPSRTAFGALLLKDNDLPSTLIICGAYHRAFLIAQFRSDVHFLLGLDIVDYSCVIGVRSRIFAGNDVCKGEHASMTSSPSSQEKLDKLKCNSSNAQKLNNLETCLAHNHSEVTNTSNTVKSVCTSKANAVDLHTEQSSFVEMGNHNSCNNNNECGYVYLHNCDGGLLSLPIYTTPDHSAAREDVYYIGLIDLLQEYNSAKKIESFAKGLINDRNAISVIPPKEYAERLIKVLERITV